ncbi:hypothetical protein JTE90_017571 [Oedothorax gibbosus]|uniref:Uncharacterized protein n=1 Tax=Oedothorax gibbosus TaxID=931172 RepID=A0AAV6TMA8_9ARAC|nr:hypothetical protein JTE90_017571 [Oedothorax gibbosus]
MNDMDINVKNGNLSNEVVKGVVLNAVIIAMRDWIRCNADEETTESLSDEQIIAHVRGVDPKEVDSDDEEAPNPSVTI